ncbi:ATP-grasp domain-containing protein [Bradyrhizobium diazoefficiens]|uniref:ATP-grasp domain-containing protein n=1 Tax=Bradyrhizobium diazoefficiens TaxID=1355477 RepID=UPI001FEF4C1D|nr:hypothetical protein [Bradyrhizobium diazoefficiens]
MIAGLAEPRISQFLTTLGRIATAAGTPTAACVPVYRQMLDSDLLSLADSVRCPVADFDAVFVRADPPITQRFRHALIQLALEETRVWFVNSPTAILALGSKIFNQRFHDRLAPGVVAAELEPLLAEMRRSPESDFVAKPLDLAGGRDVLRLQCGDADSAATLQRLIDAHGFIHLQRFVEQVQTEGEIRYLVFHGSILAAWRKRPAPGDYRANLDQGATIERLPQGHDFSDAEAIVSRVTAVAPGFVFYSIDTIGPFVNELNVENIGGLPSADALYGRDHAGIVIDRLCAELERRRAFRGVRPLRQVLI